MHFCDMHHVVVDSYYDSVNPTSSLVRVATGRVCKNDNGRRLETQYCNITSEAADVANCTRPRCDQPGPSLCASCRLMGYCSQSLVSRK